jgi:hypothetical protein
VCFETTAIVCCKLRNVGSVEDAGCVLNTGGKVNGGIGGKKGYIRSRSCDLIHMLCCVG